MAAAACARASPCTNTTLDVYVASGFTCTLGTLQFSDFSFGSDFIANIPGHTANLLPAILVTPQNTVSGIGFNFSNLGLGSSAANAVTADNVTFTVAPLSGTITGASLDLGSHSATGTDGLDTAYFQDSGTVFLLTASVPILYSNSLYTGIRSTDSTTFSPFAGQVFSGAGTIIQGSDPGTANIGDYTVLLQTTAASTAPEPASMLLFSAGLMGMAAFYRQRHS
jgi:hypothetical protein